MPMNFARPPSSSATLADQVAAALGATTAGATGATAAGETDPEGMHCQPQPNPGGTKPDRVTVSTDRVLAEVQASPRLVVTTFEEAVDLACAELGMALKNRDRLYLLPKMIGRVESLANLAASVSPDEQAAALPANSADVPAAGHEFEAVFSTDPEAAAAVSADLPALRQALLRDDFLAEMLTETAWFPQTIANARSHTLNQISTIVVGAITEARKEITATPRLAAKLQKCLDLAFGRGARAQETRRNNEQIAAKAVAKDRANRLPVPASPAPPAPPAGPADPPRRS